MRAGLVVGLLAICAGVSLLLGAMGVHLPLFTPALGVLLAWVGISLVLASLKIDAPWLAFRPRVAPLVAVGAPDTTVAFAHKPVDLRGLRAGERVRVNVICGDAVVHYDPGVPLELRTTTAFGSTEYADGVRVAFGERALRTPACSDEVACAVAEIVTVLGSTKLIAAAPAPGTVTVTVPAPAGLGAVRDPA